MILKKELVELIKDVGEEEGIILKGPSGIEWVISNVRLDEDEKTKAKTLILYVK